MFIDETGRNLWRRLTPAHKSAFFSCLVTDSGASPDFLKILKKHRVEFIIA